MNLQVENLRTDYWRYIIPSMIAQVVFTLYTIVDALMVARGVSATALAAVNIASPYLTLLWAISITFAVGASTMVARLMGEGKADNADSVFSQTLAVIAVLSIVLSIVTCIVAGPIADFLGASENTREYAMQYIRTIAPFAIFFIASYIFEIMMPIDGFPKLASTIVSTGVVLNCIFDYLFIFVFKWGVRGAAFGTALSQLMVVILYLIHFLGRKSNIKMRKFKFDGSLVWKEIWRGLPAGAADLAPGLAVFICVHFIGKYIGEQGLIAYSTVGYVAALLIIIAVAIGQGAQPLVSYYNGAGRPDVIKRILRYELRDVAVFSVISFSLICAAAPFIVRFFIPDESAELISYAVHAFRLFITFTLIDVYSIIFSQFATALERPVSGVLISTLRATVFLLAGILIMLALVGPEGIWLGLTVSEVFTLIMALFLHRNNLRYLNNKNAG